MALTIVADHCRVPLRDRTGDVIAFALLDAADAHLAQYRWSLAANGYAVRTIKRTSSVLLHREVLGLTRGDGKQGDHINGDRLDCRRANLRVVTTQQNSQNVTARAATSRHRGVSFSKRRNRWRATATIGTRSHHIGYFIDELQAAEAARAFRAEHMPYANEARSVVA